MANMFGQRFDSAQLHQPREFFPGFCFTHHLLINLSGFNAIQYYLHYIDSNMKDNAIVPPVIMHSNRLLYACIDANDRVQLANKLFHSLFPFVTYFETSLTSILPAEYKEPWALLLQQIKQKQISSTCLPVLWIKEKTEFRIDLEIQAIDDGEDRLV